jgi:hypothetical protein
MMSERYRYNGDDRVGDRRADDLRPSFKSGTVRCGGTTQRVTILNLSGGGAMIDGPEPFSEDTELLFECAETGPVVARVAWVLGKRCGLTFDHVVGLAAKPGSAAA